MRASHLWIGVLTVAVFLLTGQFMRHHDPPMASLSHSLRLMHRSRHIYILAGGLVNLVLGLYLQREAAGWRRTAQTIGSLLLLAAPVLLITAFALEPQQGFREAMPWSSAGMYALFGGCMGHLASRLRRSQG